MTAPALRLESSSAPSGFGYQIRCRESLRFVRSGGGTEPLVIDIAPEPRTRPAVAPLADWPVPESDPTSRITLYQVGRGFEFWATNGRAYRIEPEAGRIEIPEGADAVLREHVLWGLPAALCFMHRGDLAVHAAAVQIGAGAVLLAGPRRQGKTTLALAFHRNGFRVLSEDLTCCRITPLPAVLPGPAVLRVRTDVYAGHPSAGTHVVAARHGRVYLALDDDRRGGCAPVPITAVVFLRESADEIAMVRTPAAAAMPDLWALSFRLPTNQARAQAFGQLTELATAIPIWNLYRPVRFASLDATIARIVEVCQ